MPSLLTVITILLGKEQVNKAIALMLLVLGLVSLSGSAVYASYVAAFRRARYLRRFGK